METKILIMSSTERSQAFRARLKPDAWKYEDYLKEQERFKLKREKQKQALQVDRNKLKLKQEQDRIRQRRQREKQKSQAATNYTSPTKGSYKSEVSWESSCKSEEKLPSSSRKRTAVVQKAILDEVQELGKKCNLGCKFKKEVFTFK